MTMTIYGLVDPRDGLIHYVGQTNKGARRLIEHRNEHGRVNPQKTQWLQELAGVGGQPIMTVLEQCDDDDADARELYWITHGRDAGWPLVNKAHGYETTERKIDELLERAVKLGLIVYAGPESASLAQKKRQMPYVVQRAEEMMVHAEEAEAAARDLQRRISEYLEQVEDFIHGPDYS